MTLNLDNVTSYRSMRKGNNWNMRLLYMFWGWHAAKNVLIIWWIILSIFKGVFLFGRIRKGVPSEAKVVARVLPPLLLDFFPAQEIMNKVIGEFLSSQQPHPELMAQVLFKVNTCRMLLHSVLFIHRFSSKSSIGPSLNSKLSDVINIKLFCAISISWSCGWWNKKGFPLDLKKQNFPYKMPPLHDNEKILNYDGNSFLIICSWRVTSFGRASWVFFVL